MFNVDAKKLSAIQPTVRRVVVIDPNPAGARLITELMKGIGAREVYTEGDEQRGFELIQDVEPGLIFLEAVGPTLNGHNLAKRIRRSHMVCRKSPIIMVTAVATAAAIKGARDAGVHEFLRKPFTIGDVSRRVENVALKPRPWVEAINYIGPDRRRFNSGEYAGTLRRRGESNDAPVIDVADQAMRILVSAVGQFDQDPQQAVRAISQQVETLKTHAANTADVNLAMAAAGVERVLASGTSNKDALLGPVRVVLALRKEPTEQQAS